MSTASIQYRMNGEECLKSYDTRTESICLRSGFSSSNKITSIDLEQIKECNNLKTLRLEWNNLETVNLAPLANCPNLEEINLDANNIQYLDLAPLSKCTKLRSVILASNCLKNLKLDPLVNCPNLKILSLHSNQLGSIDLEPLSKCRELEALVLGENTFVDIDIEPLRDCMYLSRLDISNTNLKSIDLNALEKLGRIRHLNLNGNQLTSINLAPLLNCRNLRELLLHNNNLKRVDITPLMNCRELHTLDTSENNMDRIGVTIFNESTIRRLLSSVYSQIRAYNVPLMVRNLDLIRAIEKKLWLYEGVSWKYVHLIQCLVQRLGFEYLGFLDLTVSQFVSILEETSVEAIKEKVLNAFLAQIEAGKTTIGLDIDKVAGTALADRIPCILKARSAEIEQVTINIDEKANLKPLWITAYGYKILSTSNLGLQCNPSKLNDILRLFEEVGLNFAVSKDGKPTEPDIEMSKTMKEYIWFQARELASRSI
ncbi:MAG: leucine-rich repeat protein [Candidatus Thorarchaeota archaeon]